MHQAQKKTDQNAGQPGRAARLPVPSFTARFVPCDPDGSRTC
nr:MAG TPA: hypothetical protein [Caudoviricetes sp.]